VRKGLYQIMAIGEVVQCIESKLESGFELYECEENVDRLCGLVCNFTRQVKTLCKERGDA